MASRTPLSQAETSSKLSGLYFDQTWCLTRKCWLLSPSAVAVATSWGNVGIHSSSSGVILFDVAHHIPELYQSVGRVSLGAYSSLSSYQNQIQGARGTLTVVHTPFRGLGHHFGKGSWLDLWELILHKLYTLFWRPKNCMQESYILSRDLDTTTYFIRLEFHK